eukprot:COSAG05_NODE_932_length_6542_cov_8.110818_6_plen_109_part_01
MRHAADARARRMQAAGAAARPQAWSFIRQQLHFCKNCKIGCAVLGFLAPCPMARGQSMGSSPLAECSSAKPLQQPPLLRRECGYDDCAAAAAAAAAATTTTEPRRRLRR